MLHLRYAHRDTDGHALTIDISEVKSEVVARVQRDLRILLRQAEPREVGHRVGGERFCVSFVAHSENIRRVADNTDPFNVFHGIGGGVRVEYRQGKNSLAHVALPLIAGGQEHHCVFVDNGG